MKIPDTKPGFVEHFVTRRVIALPQKPFLYFCTLFKAHRYVGWMDMYLQKLIDCHD